MQRPAIDLLGPSDLTSVLELLEAQFREHAIELGRTQLATAAADVLANATRGAMLGARSGEILVGFAYLAYTWTLEHGGLVAWLEELYVRPELRNAGVGSALLDAACRHATQAGCRAIDLEVDSGHARAESLYRRRGFVALPRRRFALPLGVKG